MVAEERPGLLELGVENWRQFWSVASTKEPALETWGCILSSCFSPNLMFHAKSTLTILGPPVLTSQTTCSRSFDQAPIFHPELTHFSKRQPYSSTAMLLSSPSLQPHCHPLWMAPSVHPFVLKPTYHLTSLLLCLWFSSTLCLGSCAPLVLLILLADFNFCFTKHEICSWYIK